MKDYMTEEEVINFLQGQCWIISVTTFFPGSRDEPPSSDYCEINTTDVPSPKKKDALYNLRIAKKLLRLLAEDSIQSFFENKGIEISLETDFEYTPW